MDELIGSLGVWNVIWLFGVLVFVHEFGHYIVARWCGVRVEVFSIGFWKEIYGWTDKHGTRWKIGFIPLGGFVKMFGEHSVEKDEDGVKRTMSAEEEAVSFSHKTLAQRSAIVAAGPIANFLFAIVAMAIVFMTIGRPEPADFAEKGIGAVVEGSAADEAGLLAGERILSVDGTQINTFDDLRNIVTTSGGKELTLSIAGDDGLRTVQVTPRPSVTDTGAEIFLLGVQSPLGENKVMDPASATLEGVSFTGDMTWRMLQGLGQIIFGSASVDDLGGPVRIASITGDIAEGQGWFGLVSLAVLLSINLGLLNLLPIPMLDGGHLFFYAIEAIRGRPLGERAQEGAFRIGLALLLTLMVFVTVNDTVGLLQ